MYWKGPYNDQARNKYLINGCADCRMHNHTIGVNAYRSSSNCNPAITTIRSLVQLKKYKPVKEHKRKGIVQLTDGVFVWSSSAVFEDPCTAVVGASGGVLGLVGLFSADMVLNFRRMKRPILRGLIILLFFSYFVAVAALQNSGTSHLSHLGGFLCGLFPSFLFLPDLRKERIEAWFPIIGGGVMVLIFTALPSYFYAVVVKDLSCGTR